MEDKTIYHDILQSAEKGTMCFKQRDYWGWVGYIIEAFLTCVMATLSTALLAVICLASLLVVPVIASYRKIKKELNATK